MRQRLAAIRAAIVDLDGTMVDTLGDFEVALNAMLRELDLPAVSRAFIEATVGKGSEHLIRSVLAEVGGDAALYDEAWGRYQRHYQAVNGEHARVYPGVHEGLERMRAAGWRLACLTNKPGAFAQPLLKRKGLHAFFDRVFGGDAFEHKNPHPLPLQRTCEALGQAPAATLMVGDSSNDAAAARAAGCPVVLVTYGYNHGRPVSEVPCDGTLARLDALFS
jgi:phosphoglycolate phosphatase